MLIEKFNKLKKIKLSKELKIKNGSNIHVILLTIKLNGKIFK